MGGNHSFKKLAALALSAALTLGVVPLPGLVEDAHADTDAAEPSAVAYATADDLQDIPLVEGETSYTGDVTKVGRIRFGKDESGKVMEWYVLGEDEGAASGSIAIFAASDMISSAQFNTSYDLRTYDGDTDGVYEQTTGEDKDADGNANKPTKVWSSHYGASLLRKNLQSYADGTNYKYFSSAEQGIMQATTVDTPDYKKNSDTSDYAYATNPKVYSTSDKLYLPWGDPWYYTTLPGGDEYAIGGKKDTIYVGGGTGGRSKNGIPVTLGNSHLGATTGFWLRPAYARYYLLALYAGSGVSDYNVSRSIAVRPASNLKLSSVSFASAASAASSSSTGEADTIQTEDKIVDGTTKTAMMLRLDPALKADDIAGEEADTVKIGSVSVDAASSTITATKADGAEGDVTLIVQGKNSDTDWYYSRKIEGTEPVPVTTGDIAKALESKVTLTGTTDADKAAQIDLTKCKIWVETPVMETTSGNTTATASQTLFYAVQAVDGAHTCVEKENEWGSDEKSHWKICKICNQQMGDKIEHTKPTAGSGDEWQKNDTQHWQNCTVCDKEITSTKKDHTSEWYSGDENDHWQICNVCGEKLGSAEEHSFTWQVDKDNSEQHNGTCSCGRVVSEEHTDVIASDEAEHWYECSKCGVEKPDSRAKHIFKDGICTGEGCKYDGKHNITDENREGKKDPTCTEDGHEAYWKCSQKGHEDEVFLESGTGIYVLADAPTPIKALGHEAGSDYIKVDTEYDAPVCTVCSEPVTDKEEKHAFDDDGICTKCRYDRYEDEHRHVYDDTVWEDNASYHWHQCTDAECPDVKAGIKDKARHTFVGGKCDVCGRTRAYDDSSDDDDSSDTEYTAVDADGSWDQDERGWRFRYTNGTYAKGSVATAADGTAELHVGWARVAGSWFAFDADGYMMQDWIYDAASGSWYYSDLTGMKTGWMQSPQDGRWYYLDPNSGAMHINTTTPDGSRVGADGAYIPQ